MEASTQFILGQVFIFIFILGLIFLIPIFLIVYQPWLKLSKAFGSKLTPPEVFIPKTS